ncbi:MFS transporter [Burkholderia ubonensis]|uniref:MFS transporter n=1 Tax=Burkholderia ubonensis subsp. mesacidophila TaxID=265293 RepID=A0A2A4FGH8_9BURK|nr:MFS transporter [Burkholderia ubonensis]PCE31429.1 MFS transporter [Burkholderia ubonensis subsp. mesacidophila]
METQATFDSVPTARAARGAAHRWRVLGVGVAANMSFSAAATGIPTTAIWLRADYHLGNGALGLVLGALGLGVALSELPWGMAADRWGDRRMLLTGLLATATVLAAMTLLIVPSAGAVPSLTCVAAAMALVGMLGGSVNGSSGRAVMRWFREGERGLAMSIRQTAVPLGGGLGAALLPTLASTTGFAGVFGLLALLCAASAVLTWRWLHEPPEAPVRSHAPATTAAPAGPHPLRNGPVWRVVLGIGLLCAPQFAILTFATVFLHDFIRLGLAGITAAMVTIQLGAMVMRVWSGRYTDRRGNRRAYVRGSVLVAVAAFGLLALATAAAARLPAAAVVVLLVGAGVCVSAWHGVAYTELATLAGADNAGTALGMANTAVYVGLFLTPLTIPHLLAASSWSVVWLATALCAWLAYPLFPRQTRRIAQ